MLHLLHFGRFREKIESALHDAAAEGDCEKIACLLDQGGDIHLQNARGETPLHYAALFDSVEAIDLLLARGANIEAQDYDGETPLHRATLNNQFNAAEWLLKKGANVNAPDNRGITPADRIKSHGFDELKEILANHEKEPVAKRTRSKTRVTK